MMNFKLWLENEVSEKEREQMGTQKGTYRYVDEEEYKTLRPYLVAKSLKRNPKLDTELTAYTPGETLKLLENPKIKQWFQRMRTFKIPDEYGLVILVSCAATKPWGFSCKKSNFYKNYNKIRKDVINGKIKPVYFVTISEPLGVVPEELWGDVPHDIFPQYDNPGLFKDTSQQSSMKTKDWSESPLKSKREMPFDDKAFEDSIKILGKVIADFIKNNSNHEYVSFVELADKKQISTHSKMLTVAEELLNIKIPRNPKKLEVGRKRSNIANYMKKKLNL